jgi:hypothetical protein
MAIECVVLPKRLSNFEQSLRSGMTLLKDNFPAVVGPEIGTTFIAKSYD